jgi:hypothetical protein
MVGMQKVLLEPGQFITTYPDAVAETGIKLQQARDFVAALKKHENITVKTTNKFSIITIINWATYQGEDLECDSQNTSQSTSQRPVKDQTKNPSVRQVLVEEGKKGIIERVGVHAGAGAIKDVVEIPSWIPIQIWKDFKEFRLRKKAPLTNRAVKKTIEELDKLRDAGNDPEAVLEQSIYRGWTGVFALKSEFKKASPQTRAEKVRASMEIMARREYERQAQENREEKGHRPCSDPDVCILPD